MAKDREESKGNDRCTPGRVGYRDKDGTSVICIGNDVQTTVPYNPQTLLNGSSNNSSNTATYQPYIPNLGTSSLFGSGFSSGGGYVGVAESHSMHNQYGGIHAIGGGIHGRYVEPLPQQVQPVQTVAVSKTPPVVKKEVFVQKPVVTKEMTQAEKVEWSQYFVTKDKSKIKAKDIVEKIAIDQEGGKVKVLNLSNTRLSSVDMNELTNELEYLNFDLDVLSLENTPFDNTGGGLGGLGWFMRNFTHSNKGVFHNVAYLTLTNTCANYYNGDGLATKISQALGRGELSTIKAINLSGNKITDNGANYIAEALKSDNSKLEQLNLSGNSITDNGLIPIGEALKTGKVKTLKKLDMSGNKITEEGDTWIVACLKEVWQDFAIFTHSLDEIVQMNDDSKEVRIGVLKNIIERGKIAGTYDEAIVVDKSFLGSIINNFKNIELSVNQVFGFGKCHLLPEPEQMVESYAQDKIIVKLPLKTASSLSFTKKYVGKLLSFHDVVTCFVSSREDALTSELGQEVTKHDLCLIGLDEYCGEQ